MEECGFEITDFSAVELGRRIRAGDISAPEAARSYFDRIEAQDGEYHAYLSLRREQALREAEEIQGGLREGRFSGSPLAGVPVAVKDNICIRGEETTCASRMLEGFRPPYDAEVIRRLKAAGMIILGKTNMDEFAMGSTTETSAAGITRNPRNPEHVPGGSSGGSAAAVAAKEAPVALGSDTGGSIRQPSSFCGVAGLKPTYGTVSRYGLIAYASSLDQIGPIGRNVEDLAAVLEIIGGRDEKDATTAPAEAYSYQEGPDAGAAGLRIGIPKEYFGGGLDPEVRERVLSAAKVLEGQGAVLEELRFSLTDYMIPAYYVIASAEAGSNLSRYDGVKYGFRAADAEGLSELYRKSRSEGFGPEVKRRILIGAFVLSSGYYDAYYNKALKVKALIRQEFDKAFREFDLILGPTAPSTAPRLGESLSDPLKMYLGDIYTVAANLAGLPAISIPCGTDRAGLPVGLQLTGRPFGERDLFRAARAYEKAADVGTHRKAAADTAPFGGRDSERKEERI